LIINNFLFFPEGEPPHKVNSLTPVNHVLKLIELALDEDPGFVLSRVVIDRPGPHYSIDTVRIIQRENHVSELFFIMGGDVYRDLPNWDRPQEMFETCKLAVAVMRRPGFGNPDLRLDMHQSVIPQLVENAMLLTSPLVEFSSTDIVDRLTAGRSIRYMVPDSVLEYIAQHGLYKDM
jgi:nicotinate-nucleotide adenylyltransferase